MTGITRATIAELKQHLIVFLNDLELGKIYTRRWWWGLEVHGFQGLGDSIGHDKVSIPFTIGGHNVPRRFFGARCRQDIFKCLHVISPAFTFLEVARVPFPLLFGVMDSLLQPFLLLVFRNMEEKLQDRSAVLCQHVLKFSDLIVSTLHHRLGHPPMDPSNEHIFVMGPVEDANEPPWRHLAMDTPEEVPGQFFR